MEYGRRVSYELNHGSERAQAGRPRHYRRAAVGWGGGSRQNLAPTGSEGAKHVFLRNEPTVFHRNVLCNLHCVRGLWLRFIREFGGFVLENEPTGGGF